MSDWGQATFTPRRVALVGASTEAGKLGHLFWQNLSRDFQGEVVAVHPRGECAKVSAAPGPVDLAVIVTPAASVPEIVADCAAAGVKVAVIISGGFAEAGDEGGALQARTLRAARAGGMRLVGPNCFGVVGVGAGLNASLGMGLPKAGGVALYTQSGAYGMAAFMRSHDDGIGFAKVIATGNTADVDATDAVEYFAQDPETRVIALLLESIDDGVGLIEAIRQTHKPVVVLKTGRGSAGQRAAASHTAALAGDHAVARAALRQAGAMVVEDGLTLLDVAGALDRQPPLAGRRVAIVTNSGGTGVELADLLEEQGMAVPQLSQALQREIAQHLPAHASAGNPVDVTPLWAHLPQMYAGSLRALLASDEVDAVVPVLLQRAALNNGVVDAVIEAAKQGRKPVHVCWVAPREADEKRLALMASGVPCHAGPLATARVLARCVQTEVYPAPELGEALPAPEHDGWLSQDAAFEAITQLGLDVTPWRIAASATAAVEAARELGFPVVVKVAAPGDVHKASAGLIRLGLADADAVRQAANALGDGPFVVQSQAPPGVELMLGVRHDPRFGMVAIVGLGGVWTEVLGDVAMRVAPLGAPEAAAMLGELRGRDAIPRPDNVGQVLARFAQGVARMPWCAELDVNPMIVSDEGIVAVDARLRVRRPV